jgi:hypothetical protein
MSNLVFLFYCKDKDYYRLLKGIFYKRNREIPIGTDYFRTAMILILVMKKKVTLSLLLGVPH